MESNDNFFKRKVKLGVEIELIRVNKQNFETEGNEYNYMFWLTKKYKCKSSLNNKINNCLIFICLKIN